MSDLNDFEDAPDVPTPLDSDGGNTNEDVRVVASDVSCENCQHRGVCAVYKGIEPMFRDWASSSGEVPFELDELAVICGYYAEEEDG